MAQDLGNLDAFAFVKLVLPFDAVRRQIDPVHNAIATAWIAGNSGWMRLTQRTEWDVAGVAELLYAGWYLVNANHQTWVDIFVLQHLLSRRIPLLKFFLKPQLIWVPVIGLAWWALDFPFMKRHGKADLRRNPQLRHQDRDATQRACAKFALVPTSVMNFAEGTRCTPDKHRVQHSPYRHLLKPKAVLALALNGCSRFGPTRTVRSTSCCGRGEHGPRLDDAASERPAQGSRIAGSPDLASAWKSRTSRVMSASTPALRAAARCNRS